MRLRDQAIRALALSAIVLPMLLWATHHRFDVLAWRLFLAQQSQPAR